jgi:hypothetical protein
MGRNAPSSPELVVKENGNMQVERETWIALLEHNAAHPNPNFIHPFFGKMTPVQIGQLAYKHIDHHLRQFNA